MADHGADNDTSTDNKESRIRQLAFELWEQDGQPEGRSEEYWHRARDLIEATKPSPEPPAPSGATKIPPTEETF